MHNTWPRMRLTFAGMGLGYLLFVAACLSQLAGTPYGLTCATMFTAAAFLTVLLLAWLTRWARRDDVRGNQFSLSTLLSLITLLALFLALVRWLVSRQAEPPGLHAPFFLIFAAFFLVLLLSAVPGVLFVADAVLWLSVWLVRRPAACRWRLKWRQFTNGRFR